MAAKAKQTTVDDIEIVGISGHSTGGRRKPLTKSSRKQALSSEIVHVRHLPSGREMFVEIPEGHYSKREMQRLRIEAKRRFLAALKRERRV